MTTPKEPDEYMVWGVAFLVGCVFLYCLPKVVLVLAVTGLVLGYATIKPSKKRGK